MTVVLAIESATDAAGVALADGSGLLAEVRVGRGRRHAETIAPGVEAVCRLAGIALREVDVVVVDVGPGLFTGLRVGIATAKGIAFGLGLPMVPVTSLDVLAAAVAAGRPASRSGRTLVAVVDARRGEVFWARYRLDWGSMRPVAPGAEAGLGGAEAGLGGVEAGLGGVEAGIGGAGARRSGAPGSAGTGGTSGATGTAWDARSDGISDIDDMWSGAGGLVVPVRLSEPRASAPDVLAAEIKVLAGIETDPPLVVGDGALRYAAVLAGTGAIAVHGVLARPMVDVLAAVGVWRADAGLVEDPAGVDALYVREADARINWERRRPQRPAAGDTGGNAEGGSAGAGDTEGDAAGGAAPVTGAVTGQPAP